MGLPVQTKQILISGANVVLRVGLDDAATFIFGLVSNVSYNENFQVQKANVIGHLGPVSMDPQDYSCEITIGAFVANVSEHSSDLVGDKGNMSINPWIPARETALNDGSKFGYLDFYDSNKDKVLAAFKGVIVSSSGVQVEGGGYVRQNIQMMALERISLVP